MNYTWALLIWHLGSLNTPMDTTPPAVVMQQNEASCRKAKIILDAKEGAYINGTQSKMFYTLCIPASNWGGEK